MASGHNRSTLDALVAYIKANLFKTVEGHSGAPVRVLSETAVRFNDSTWFWTDDNAKAAELLCEPAIYDADPSAAEAALDFVLRMSQGLVIQRRGGPAELRVIRGDPADFRIETAFFIIDGDLTRGVVRHGLRFNDNRTMLAAEHTGNLMTYRRKRRIVTLDIEDAVTSYAIDIGDRVVSLSFTSTLRQPRLWRLGRPGTELAQIIYTYTVSADHPSIGLTVTFTAAPATALRDVIVTTALDHLNRVPGVNYGGLAFRVGKDNRFVRDVPYKKTTFHAGPVDYSAVVQTGASAGFSYGVHVLHRDGRWIEKINGHALIRGRLLKLVYRYGLGEPPPGVPIVIREDRMVTGGGYYDALGHYCDVMQRSDGGGEADPSMSYDVGAELNAVAVHLLFARRGCYREPPSEARLAALAAWYDRHIERYFDFVRSGTPDDLRRVFTRGIAFVVLSLDCMLRATGEERYRALLETGVGLILRLAIRRSRGRDIHESVFADVWESSKPFLDCHAACVLALARAAWHGDPKGTIGQAIREAIPAVQFYTGIVDLGLGHSASYDGLAVLGRHAGAEHADTGFWHFKLGLVLRALHAARHAADAGVLAMDDDDRLRLAQRLTLAEALLVPSLRRHGDMLEILTSRFAGETNSETQPWVALGLVPVLDEQIVALSVPARESRQAEGAPA